MTLLRLAATVVTGGIMLVGGVVLSMAGPPLVVALGVGTAAVGVVYTLAGITSERAIRSAPQPSTQTHAGRWVLNRPLAAWALPSPDDHRDTQPTTTSASRVPRKV